MKRYHCRAKMRKNDGESEAEFQLKDYLGPNGRYPYDDLTQDMEDALEDGHNVSLISVPGFLMVSGWPNTSASIELTPWHVCNYGDNWVGTAKEALRG